MIEAGAVGATFTIVDQASAVLKRIADQLNVLQEKIDRVSVAFKDLGSGASLARFNRQLGIADDRLAAVGATADKAALGISGAFDKAGVDLAASMARATGAAIADLDRLAAAGKLAGAAGGGGRWGGAGRGTGGEGGGWGGAARRLAGPLAGIVSPEMLGAGVLGYGIYSQAQIEDAASKMLLTGQVANTAEARSAIVEAIRGASSKTGFGPKAIADAMLDSERVLAGLPFAQRMDLEKGLLPSAAYEARMKGTSIVEAQEGLVKMAHMSGIYDPAGVEEVARKFAYASTITTASISKLVNTMSYSLPELHASLGMDPGSVMLLTAMSQNAGVGSTKSGTWLRSLFERSVPLPGESKSVLAHNAALVSLGLADNAGHNTWMLNGPDGKTDWSASLNRFADSIAKFNAATSDPGARLAMLHTAFGERGASEASIMAVDTFLSQLPQLQAKMAQFQGGAGGIDALNASSPVAQWNKSLADTEVLLTRLGETLMPAFVHGLQGVDAVITHMNDALKAGGVLDQAQAYAHDNPAAKAVQGLEAWIAGRAGLWGSSAGPAGAYMNGGGPGDAFKGAVALAPVSISGIGAAMTAAAAAIKPPEVKADTKVDVKVTLDGAAIAAGIESRIASENRVINGTSGADTGAAYMPTDGGVGHQ